MGRSSRRRRNGTCRSALYMLTLTSICTKAIKIQPSVIGYIAKSAAHVGMGEREKAYQACDIAFKRFHSSHGNFILLSKVYTFQNLVSLSC